MLTEVFSSKVKCISPNGFSSFNIGIKSELILNDISPTVAGSLYALLLITKSFPFIDSKAS